MLKIAVVEDQKSDADFLKECINKYAAEKELKAEISEFSNGMEFLESENIAYDIIFMDVKMPLLNGIKTAKKLREINNFSCLVFITSMANYALYGYEVDAADYILKPVNYEVFSYKMKKLLNIVSKRKNDSITVKIKGGILKIVISDVRYLELVDHRVVYHTVNGDVESWDTLANAFKMLEKNGFAYCNSGYIVNLAHVTSIMNSTVVLDEKINLPISRNKKAQFMEKFTLATGR